MSESESIPDPVTATAPEAPAAPDDDASARDVEDPQPGAVFPIGGMGTGTAIPVKTTERTD
jgi:hypothetical protein